MTDAARNAIEAAARPRRFSVKAAALFCSETAWHIGDVAVPQWTVVKE
jgi:hypothetical protein